ncbi:site-specific integrase [Pseudonocardia nigra]|uniref:site-specific integrase n=1 Tax=Pseudonocardia nigra TaxID=1921578 RepID=UPI001C5D1D9F|nr:tyrosine-type recombinase/integrase [Pseudonocardia nigra]
MSGRPRAGKARARGNIETLRSGALRVRVYAGIDPVTKKRHNLIEVVPPGPDAMGKAELIRDRFLIQVAEKRNPRTSATLDQLLSRYLDQFHGAPNTLDLYRSYVRKHISPLLGRVGVGQLDPEALDSFYAELRRCRDHCSGRRTFTHRTDGEHECDGRCGPHVCRGLGPATVRHMHFLLSGAFERAVRWRWVAVNPVRQARPPAAPKPNPQPPTPAEAARIVTEAWRDPDWGAFVWTTMTIGARRGEMCAIRRSSLSLDEGRETVWLRKAIRKEHGTLVEAELKTHQQRRVALDPGTAEVLREHLERCDARARALGIELPADAFLFSPSPDGSTFPAPESVTQRYDRLAARLGIETTFHKLRHYSATELIAGGVDPRTVAGRLGHSGGGTTTLRTYSAWVAEADQRAAHGLGAGMPPRPPEVDEATRARTNPRYPYEVLAAGLAEQIEEGVLAAHHAVPPAAALAAKHGVSLSTAKRALSLAQEWGLLTRFGNRLRVVPPIDEADDRGASAPSTHAEPAPGGGSGTLLTFRLRHLGAASMCSSTRS